MVQKISVWSGNNELVKNALFHKGGPLRMVPKLPLSAEMKGFFSFQTAITRELSDLFPPQLPPPVSCVLRDLCTFFFASSALSQVRAFWGTIG